MLCCFSPGGFWIIGFFPIALSCNPVIFESGIFSDTGRQIILYIFIVQVPAYITVIFAVVIIPWIAFCCTPDLPGGFGIPAKGCYTGGCKDGCIKAVTGPWFSEK